MTDGKYQQGTDATTLDFAYIGLTQFVSVGDLTGDGVNEIAAIFLENYGGTGNFGLLTIYSNVNGLPVFLTSTFIDDRPMINSMSIENGEVFLDAITHGAQDGGCCPTLPTTRRYALVNNQLRMVNYTTATPEGAKRIVEITAPVNGPVMVTAPDFGAPGTFNETFTLEGIPPGTTIYLEIQDISAADGSWLAMDAVKLVIK